MLTETWLKCSVSLSPLLGSWCSHYECLRCDRPRKKGGGVALFCKSSFSPVMVFSESIPDSYELLCCDICADLRLLRIVLVYRTPSCTGAKTEQLLKALSDMLSCEHLCLLVGDFNFPDISWTSPYIASNSVSRDFLDLIRTHNLKQHVHNPTIGNNILDLVFSNDNKLVENVSVWPPLGIAIIIPFNSA